MLKGSGGSETSIVISDEGTDWEVLEEGDDGRMTSSPIKVGNPNVDRLWILEDDDGPQDREHETHGQECDISIPNIEQDEVLEFVGVVGDTDHCSDSSSTASGPTLSADFTLQSACPTCAKLFRKMRKLKHWEKSIDYDPMSLSCDQWVSKKIWRPRTLSNRKGKLWTHLSRIRKRALSSIEAGEMQQPKTSCSRPHVFLHRNLSLCKRKEARDHRKPCHMSTTVDCRQRVVRVGAKESRRQKKRKLCEMEPQWEEPQEEGRLRAHCTSTSSSSYRGDEAALNVHEDSGSEDKNRARRKLEWNGVSVTQDPQRQYEKPQSQKTTQQDIKRDAHCTSLTSAARRRSKTFKPSPVGGPLDHYPWVQGGGFRSMLAELEGNRNMVVQELARLSVNKLN
ncbi:hypothetical protein SKAU_G00238670 [Synaphobranchus kaupii]|uniref:Uncharacterized protein n=1 Tax=Synaphobranchus kaupii TaxID=118154 RepID=A0A9Q1IU37_SYNKA|nr:hypothetical protein SKAU_G00238670 [Synaphobranchus kaupii]